MCDDYARAISQRVVAQLAEGAGFESAQESSIEILGDLLIRYISEVASGSHAYAEMASRSDANAHDIFLSLDDLGSDAEQLEKYFSSLSVSHMMSHDSLPTRPHHHFPPPCNTQNDKEGAFHQPPVPFPVRHPARSMPSFASRGERPPPHIPSFLPAFPDPHTYRSTPTFAFHETNPERQALEIQGQKRAAEKALLQLHKRAKLALASKYQERAAAAANNSNLDPSSAELLIGDAARQKKALLGSLALGTTAAVITDANAANLALVDPMTVQGPGTEEGPAGAHEAGPLSALAAGKPSNPFLKPPLQVLSSPGGPHTSAATANANGSDALPPVPIVSMPEQVLLDVCPYYIILKREPFGPGTRIVVKELGPSIVSPGGGGDAMAIDKGPQSPLVGRHFLQSFDLIHPSGCTDEDKVGEVLTSNPFRTLVVKPKGTGSDGELEGYLVPAKLKLRVPNSSNGSSSAVGGGARGGVLEDVLLILARPRTSTDADLVRGDKEAEEELLHFLTLKASQAAASSSSPSTNLPAQTDQATVTNGRETEAVLGGEVELALKDLLEAAAENAALGKDLSWRRGEVRFEDASRENDASAWMRPSVTAAPVDWATATRAGAMALVSDRPIEDAYGSRGSLQQHRPAPSR